MHFTAHKKTYWYLLIIFLFIFSFAIPKLANAVNGTKLFGETCDSSDDCKSGQCDSSDLSDAAGKTINFCDCGVTYLGSESDMCRNEYGAPGDGGIWKCSGGGVTLSKLNYCQSTVNNIIKYPDHGSFKPQTPNWLNLLTDPRLTADILGKMSVDEMKTVMITKPEPIINIPGLNFSDPEVVKSHTVKEADGGTYLYIPYIGEYMAAVYKYAIVVAAILSIIMIIVGGITWTISAGSTELISSAKKRIGGAIIGLVLALASYVLLYTINPELVQFRSLRVNLIEPQSIEKAVFSDPRIDPGTYGSATKYGSNDFDSIFQAFANCSGGNWQIYKAFAQIESGINPNAERPGFSTVKNAYYGGLLGTTKTLSICKDELNKVGWGDKCTTLGLFDPLVSTALTSVLWKGPLTKIQTKCPTASIKDKAFMLYYAHAKGPGSLACALENISHFPCNTDNWPAENPGANTNESVIKWTSELTKNCTKVLIKVSDLTDRPIYGYANDKSAHGAPKRNIDRVANMLAKNITASEFNVPINKSLCPYETSFTGNLNALYTPQISPCDPAYDGKKILVVGDSITNNTNSYSVQLQKACPNLIVERHACGCAWITHMWNGGYAGNPVGCGVCTDSVIGTGKTGFKNVDFSQYNDFILLAGINGVTQDLEITKNQLKAFYDKAHTAKARVIAISLTPTKGWAWGADETKAFANTAAVNEWLKNEKNNGDIDIFVDAFGLLVDPANANALKTEYHDKTEFLHFNSAGHKAITAQLIQQAYTKK